MIETVLLIALGFTVASLLALLMAPAIWRRAVKLTTRRIEATMPLSVADISADKDLLRADYAVELRRLELALGKAKERAARHLMERNRHTVELGKLETEIAMLKSTLAERTQASSVLEQTVKKRLPELESQCEHAYALIAARELELTERATAFNNQTEALTLAQKMVRHQEQEINQLRDALESVSGDRVNFWGKEIGDDKDRAEIARQNGKLNAELSRLREDLMQRREIDAADAAELRAEMHRLADLMLSGKAVSKPKISNTEPELTAPGAGAAQGETPNETPEKTRPAKSASGDAGGGAKGRKSLSERLAILKRKEQKEDA